MKDPLDECFFGPSSGAGRVPRSQSTCHGDASPISAPLLTSGGRAASVFTLEGRKRYVVLSSRGSFGMIAGVCNRCAGP
jgi:hypothetical protein